jgi:Saxitoxin biosynthesis operon protein SxtJ
MAGDHTHSHVALTPGSNRQFGFVIAAALFVFAAWRVWHGAPWNALLLLLSVVFALCAWIAPVVLAPLNRLWFALGLALGKIVAPIVMGLIFFVIVTPVALWRRMRGHDSLGLRREAESFWQTRASSTDFKRQF